MEGYFNRETDTMITIKGIGVCLGGTLRDRGQRRIAEEVLVLLN